MYRRVSAPQQVRDTGISAGGSARVDRGFTEHHRLYFADIAGERDTQCDQQYRRPQGYSCIAVVMIKNSLANTPNGGMRVSRRCPAPSPAHCRVTCSRPRIWPSVVCRLFCTACPTAKNIADLVSECMVKCASIAAKVATGPPMQTRRDVSPICSMENRPNMRLMSFFLPRQKPALPHHREQPEAHHQIARKVCCPADVHQHLVRITAINATFSSRPESTAETGVGPSACASGQPAVQRHQTDLGA